jgi:hypothetical protein
MSMRRRLATLTLSPVLLAAAACGGLRASARVRPANELPPVGDWRPLVGCYHSTYISFGLDSVPALTYWNAAPAGALQAWRYGDDYRGDLYWSITPDGYATLVAHNGLDGSTTRYRLTGDTLVGFHDGWSDIGIPRRRPDAVIAVRRACPGITAHPPPNPDQLSATFIRGLAGVLRDSLLPRFPGVRLLQIPWDAPRSTAVVSSILGAHSQGDTAVTFGLRLEVEDAVSRDRATATVTASLCEPRTQPENLRVELTHYEFVRGPGAWRLVSSTLLQQTTGHCGPAPTPPSP